ncbi:acyl-CoA thioesterase [candidate division KSB1 bacterium]|nr:acyl-CoA thioesterase [candidate division KSB1 bacterium]
MSEPLTIRFRVRSYELDSFGHVNNAVYLNYLELARGEFLRQRGLSFTDFHRWKVYPYVIRINIEYKSSSNYDDELEISGKITNQTFTSFTLEKEIFNLTTNKMTAKAEVVLAFVNEKQRPTRIPEEFKQKFLH